MKKNKNPGNQANCKHRVRIECLKTHNIPSFRQQFRRTFSRKDLDFIVLQGTLQISEK